LKACILAEPDRVPRMPKRAGLPVLESHGRHDPRLPFEIAELLWDRLAAAGLDVRFVAFNGPPPPPPR
jgi:phospholipase/carboxylesterase